MEVKAKTQKTGELKDIKIVNCLYSYFKDSSERLKIICDWDEVIQPHEPYALWLTWKKNNPAIVKKIESVGHDFTGYFKNFWNIIPKAFSDLNLKKRHKVIYFSYGSKLIMEEKNKEELNQQQIIKNSPNFYQQAPFLSIAKELLMLIKAGKVEQLIFLTAYDKRKFPQGDPRKQEIFKETFGKFPNCSLQLIGFDNESQGANKADWIKENASDFDLIIDDNPLICRSIAGNITSIKVIAPYYPVLTEKHHLNVILVKTSVSDWEKKDFK